MHLLTHNAELTMPNYTRNELIQLLDRAMSYIENPGLYSDKELTDMLDEMQDVIDTEQTVEHTWE
jgi:hypothetical protein